MIQNFTNCNPLPKSQIAQRILRTDTKELGFSSLVSQVRWADIEERRKQLKMRELGFIVGSCSNWIDQKAEPFDARKALEKTKLIPNRLEAE